jgi:hypothetical protein
MAHEHVSRRSGRSPSAIFATFDETGAVAGLSSMPELTAYRGHGFKANERADKVCDTVMYSRSRFIPDAVLLDDVRHDRTEYLC